MDRYGLHEENIKNIEKLAFDMPDSIDVGQHIKKIEGVRIYFRDARGNEDEDVYYDVADGDVYSYGCCTKVYEYEIRENLVLFYGQYARTVVGN